MILPARLRWEGRWVTATVRDVSSRGLMLAAAVPPPPGSYVEIQIGPSLIAARTVWVNKQQCGFQSRERIDVGGLAGGRPAVRAPVAERRRAPRAMAASAAEQSRQLALLLQYGFAACFALTAASSVAWEVHQALSAPVTAIEKQL